MNRRQTKYCLFGLIISGCLFLFSCKKDANSNNGSSFGVSIDTLIEKTALEANQLRDETKYVDAIDLLKSVRNNPDFSKASSPSRAYLLQRIGVMYFLREDFYSAKEYLDSTLMIRSSDEVSTKAELARSYFIRSGIYIQREMGKEATEDIQRAISLVEKTAEKDILIEYYLQMASAFQIQRDFGQAEYYYQKCLDLNGAENNFQLSVISDRLGRFYALQGKYDQQLKMHQKALKISKELGLEKTRNHLVFESNIANYYLDRRNLKKAKKGLSEVLAKADNEDGDYHSLRENTLNNLAMVEMMQGEVLKAQPYYVQLLDLSRQINPSPYSISRGRAYEGLGDVEAALGEFDSAISNFHEAVKSLCIGFDNNDVYSNPTIGKHLVLNSDELLRILGFKADAIFGKYQKTKNLSDLKATMEVYRCLDQLLTNTRKQFKAAASRYRLIANNMAMYEKGTEVAIQIYEATQQKEYLNFAFNFATKNKAVVLQDGLQDEQAKFAGVPSNVLKEEKSLKKKRYLLEADIVELENSKNQKGLKSKRNERFTVVRDYEKLIQGFEEDYPKYHQLKHQSLQAIDPDQISSQLPKETALIDFFVGQRNIYVFAVTALGLNYYILPKPKGFKKQCTEYRLMFQENNTSPRGKQFVEVSSTLYKTLLEKPLADLKNKSTLRRLIIIPDDCLLQISFDGLLTQPLDLNNEPINWSSMDVPYLLRDYAISYAYSNQILLDNKKVKRVKRSVEKFAGFGLEYDDYTLEGISDIVKMEVDTTLVRGMGKLFHSVEEVSKVQQIIGDGSVWKNTAATKKAFIKNAPKASILHLAMHGFESNDSPLNAGLIFSRKKGDPDFILKAADLYGLSLSADMTVLSACNTATGAINKGEGVRSLARAFQYAGCNSLVASLWSISDHTTKDIMISFYDFLKSGDAKDVALQKAKLEYLKIAAPSQTMPFYWTNVVVIGDTRNLSF